MPAPLTPIERFLREDTKDRRTKYEQRRAEQGLVRVNLWVPRQWSPLLRRFAARLVARYQGGGCGDVPTPHFVRSPSGSLWVAFAGPDGQEVMVPTVSPQSVPSGWTSL